MNADEAPMNANTSMKWVVPESIVGARFREMHLPSLLYLRSSALHLRSSALSP